MSTDDNPAAALAGQVVYVAQYDVQEGRPDAVKTTQEAAELVVEQRALEFTREYGEVQSWWSETDEDHWLYIVRNPFDHSTEAFGHVFRMVVEQ